MAKNDEDENKEEEDSSTSSNAPFACLVGAEDVATDKRRVSLRYYLVPKDWDSSGDGGGIEFQRYWPFSYRGDIS